MSKPLSLKRNRKLRCLIAALLVLSAAICARAQSHAAGRDGASTAPPPSKQNARQPAPEAPAKQNAREKTDREASIEPASLKDAADAPRYFYEFKQPDFIISHLVIEHDRDGKGRISFERRGGGDEPIVEPVELSEAARARINALWDALGFLNSNENYQSDKKFPHLGTMSLRLKQGGRERVADFNWTDNRDAAALVDEYKRVGEQAVLLFDISVARENDPLNAPRLMDQLEGMLNRNALSDPRQLIPLLRDLSTDERIPLIARNHAGRLLKRIEK